MTVQNFLQQATVGLVLIALFLCAGIPPDGAIISNLKLAIREVVVRTKLKTTPVAGGNVDTIVYDGYSTSISGWAADIANKSEVKSVHIRFNGEDLRTIYPSSYRTDVSNAIGLQSTVLTGFRASIMGKIPASSIEVFTELSNGQVSRLK